MYLQFYSTVTAQDVSVDSLVSQPSCSNNTLIFNCQVNFPSFLIRWNHITFEEIEFIGVVTVLGRTNTTSNGQVVANLTRRTLSSPGLYLLSSTLIIHPPLNSLNLNNTNIMCEGSGGTGIRSGDANISLYGEQYRMYLIMYDYLIQCYMYSYRCPFPS